MTTLRTFPRLATRSWVLLLIGAALVLSAACGGDDNKSSSSSSSPSASGNTPAAGATAASDSKTVAGYARCPAGSASSITGAGSTFIFPLMSKWVDDEDKTCKVQVNYQSVGSGAGISQITAKTVDFGGTDGILTDEQEKAAVAAGGPILHIAATSGSEAVIFNLPGISNAQLKLDGPTLADIYMGTIKKWDDAKIKALNSGVNLPSADIAVVHRSDGSGTTFIFTNYLSKVSDQWSKDVGYATSVKWPVGIGGQGNEGVAGQVKQLPGAIGYVELAYAKQNNLPWAQMKNKSGSFVEPTLAGTTAAASGITVPADMKMLITDSINPQAYPIAGFTWALAYVNQPDPAKGKALASFLWWAIHDGQSQASTLNYGPLSSDVTKAAEAQILKMQCAGSPCLTK